jgi:hypothetical protein
MIVAGVDISLRRGQTVALLDRDALTAEVCAVRGTSVDEELAAVVELVAERGATVVAVDSPLRPCLRLLTQDEHRDAYGVPDRPGLNGRLYERYRVCDYDRFCPNPSTNCVSRFPWLGITLPWTTSRCRPQGRAARRNAFRTPHQSVAPVG